jgi:hypothetical protein
MVRGAFKARRARARQWISSLVDAIESDDEVVVERLLAFSSRHRAFAPLALMTGAFAMLLHGIRLLFTNWRLTLVQALPALWLWLAMVDLKTHVLHGRSLHVIRGPVLIPIWLAIIALTAAALFLNAVFAYAIKRAPRPEIRPAIADARGQLGLVLAWGAVIGSLLAFATTIATRWGRPWFALCLGVVVGVMMISYLAVPARVLGGKPAYSRRDKIASGVLGGLLSATVCTPAYLLGRVAILLLGSLLVPGVMLLVIAATLQAGATGAVSAIKMTASLTASGERTSTSAAATVRSSDPGEAREG